MRNHQRLLSPPPATGTRLPAQGHFGLAGNAGWVAIPAPSVDDAAPEI
jgi:hypothetical protein